MIKKLKTGEITPKSHNYIPRIHVLIIFRKIKAILLVSVNHEAWLTRKLNDFTFLRYIQRS